MTWNLTAGAARAGAALRLRRRWTSPPAQAADGADVFTRVAARAQARLGPADAKALDTAFDEIGADAPVLRRALATGAHVGAVASLAGAWATLDEPQRAMVRDPIGRRDVGPVSLLGVPARQVDATTCGPASLALMLAVGDPFVALWLATGRHAGDYVPLEPLVTEVVTPDVRTVEERWHSLQRELHREVRRWALGPFPWPRVVGSPPWRLDNTVRFAGVVFHGRMIDDRDPDDMSALILHASSALADGIPVPLYVGGDTRLGLGATVPRHVVLLVARQDGGFLIYEPGSARLHRVTDAQLRAVGEERLPGFGNWSRVTWAVLPTARSRVSLAS